MVEERARIRVMFTVICGTDSCPSERTLRKFRKLSDNPSDPAQKVQAAAERRELVDSMKNNLKMREHPATLIEVAHYRMENRDSAGELLDAGRDVFVGLAEVDSNVLSRNLETGRLEIDNDNGRLYLDVMFQFIFQDFNKPGDDDFCWLTWVVVPLVEALEGRFNPLGMGGVGKC
jgi:hypothetical protein